MTEPAITPIPSITDNLRIGDFVFVDTTICGVVSGYVGQVSAIRSNGNVRVIRSSDKSISIFDNDGVQLSGPDNKSFKGMLPSSPPKIVTREQYAPIFVANQKREELEVVKMLTMNLLAAVRSTDKARATELLKELAAMIETILEPVEGATT